MTHFNRREFIKTASAGAACLLTGTPVSQAKEAGSPETMVKVIYDGLSADQRKLLCFDWDHIDGSRGLLRTRVANNWHITKPTINSEFFAREQRQQIRAVFEGIIRPEWQERIDKQLKDDAGGFGNSQNIAIFGKPGQGNYEMVMTGRHMTLRCDGNSAAHVAFGGPIFYGHAPRFNEKPGHPGNVYWEQALAANKVYQMLDGRQRKLAEVSKTPREQSVGFKGKDGNFQGIPVSQLSDDQKEHVQKGRQKLIEPYRKSDQDEVISALKKQGGLDACHLAFFTDRDLGNDGVWDNWRLEGPSFVWHYRGAPHVHVWVNVASDASAKLNA
jgi:3-hydroxymyristoyl/3-hydroxydecanoyl-(acyl carrier protein) dehydratase